MPVNYQLAKIYKIEPLNPEHDSDVYIGSTCEASLAHRLASHRRNYKSWKKGNGSHVRSFDLFDKYGENCQILLFESYPCLNKDELRKKEGYYIKTIQCVNKLVAGRTAKEFSKQYYENNREHIKEHYKNNRDHIKEIHKQYYENNRDVISKWRNTKFKCICGGAFIRKHKARHMKCLKHINYMTQHDDIMNKVNDLMISIKQLKPICSINYSNI